ncbi:hypothetical protein AWB69_05982 [Caballeronia udeis]|uniref:Uncharacterized protein n=1 Tax=Caballeronia udeis TaxID=1232866 RepID=A0A158IH98_9BURK|nr:DUF2280 domain-containing protein [Caballeronia udeis]SAL55659.1 hypothetical protein AWB69_05982 [Caballeronia udeis]
MAVSFAKKTKPGPAKGTALQLLPVDVKRFIVQKCAQYERAADVVRMVKDEFGLEVATSGVNRYNLDHPSGAKLSPELVKLFYTTRREFEEELTKIPGMVRAKRIERLDGIYHKAVAKGDLKTAVAAMVALRREMENFEVVDDEQQGDEWPAA